MKKLIIGLLTFQLLVSNVFAADIEVNSKVESVTIYHSGALVKRNAAIQLKSGVNVLVFKNVSSKIVLSSLKINNKQVTLLNKTIIKKMTKEELNQLMDKKEALTKQMTLIETKYNEAGFVSEVEDLEKMSTFYAEKTLQIKKELRAINQRIEEERQLEAIDLKNEDAAILKLIVSVDGSLNESFAMQYVCGGIGWSPAYEIYVENASDKTVKVKYLAKAMSQTGEDWDNVIIHLSSSFPLDSPTDLPKLDRPWVLDGNGFNRNSTAAYGGQGIESPQQQIDKLEGVNYQEISIPSFLKQITLNEKYSIKSNSTVFTFPIQTAYLPAEFYYYGFPSLDPEVFLVAQVTGWDTLGFVDGVADITFNNNSVGKSIIKFSEARDTLLLPIGKDNSVYMKRSEMADKKFFKETSVGKKKVTTLAYRYELKNNNSFPVKFELFDQIPVSQTKSADVEVEKSSNGNIDPETGEINWHIDLKQGQAMEKELIFTINMSSTYRFINSKSERSYRTISCPTF